MNLKCLNFKSKYWNKSYGFLKTYGLRCYFKFYCGFVKSKSMHPNLVIQSHTKVFLFFIFFIFRINDRQSHTKLFSVYVGLEKKPCMVQSSMD